MGWLGADEPKVLFWEKKEFIEILKASIRFNRGLKIAQKERKWTWI